MSGLPRPRIAVVGHVEHVTLARAPALPAPGDILHLDAPIWFPGGGGGMVFAQLVKGPIEAHLFTAVGADDAGAAVADALAASGGTVHVARRSEPHARALVLVTPDGERTILVVGAPNHPCADDPLPWELLATCDAAYFTAEDAALVRVARGAQRLVVTARRREALVRSGVRADVVVGSVADARERSTLADYPVPPGAVVMTDGPRGGTIETADGAVRFPAPPSPPPGGTAYGAGDSFAAALTYFLAAGVPLADACRRAGPHGAAVLRGADPLRMQRTLDPA